MLALAALTAVPLAWTACGSGDAEQEGEPSLQALHDVPVFRPALSVTRRGSGDALEMVFHAGTLPDTVAAFYRRTFVADGWAILGDGTTPDGTISLYAERNGIPVWVLIKRRPAGQGTEFTLIGAAPDTTETTS